MMKSRDCQVTQKRQKIKKRRRNSLNQRVYPYSSRNNNNTEREKEDTQTRSAFHQ